MKFFLRKSNSSRVREMERQLQETRDLGSTPSDLHDSIMHAVRMQGEGTVVLPPRRREAFAWLKWVALPGSALILLLGFLVIRQNHSALAPSSQVSTGLFAPAQALQLSENLTATLPSALTPLSEELARVQKDVDSTTEFLVSSLP